MAAMSSTRRHRTLRSRITRWWKRAGLPARAGAATTAFIAAICIMAVIMGLIRVVQWQRRVDSAKADQQLMEQEFDFNPGDIISDGQFFNSHAMSAAEVQSFLDDHGASCSGSRCLKSMTFETTAHDADELCAAYQSSGRERAAEIIDKSARACGISQQVLLTMLQKEQHLITATDATDYQFKAAVGLSCPDDANCDPQYAGFFNQVYGAAKRYQYYRQHSKDYAYRSGTLNHIQFNPDASCGGADVYIANEATALLYIYTPYQPNTAVLQANGGEGDSCSSYGNRNFAMIYSQWFGSPRR